MFFGLHGRREALIRNNEINNQKLVLACFFNMYTVKIPIGSIIVWNLMTIDLSFSLHCVEML
jgi:hypothetical protein